MKPLKNKTYQAIIGGMECVCCSLLDQKQQGRTTVHHIREAQGMSQRASDFLSIPLCYDCHQGPNGIHGDRALLRVLKCEELDLLAETYRRVVAQLIGEAK
jgi:hypothetical protein